MLYFCQPCANPNTRYLSLKSKTNPTTIVHANLPTTETLRPLLTPSLSFQTTAKNQKQNTPKAGRLA